MSMSKMFLTEIDHEMATTRKVLEAVPEGKWDWKPHEKSMTLGRLAGHIAENAEWAVTMMDSEDFDLAQFDDESFSADSREGLLAAFDKNVEACKNALKGRPDADFGVVWTMRQGEQQILSMPRAAVIRSWILNHLIHHRGQLSVYLRLLDATLPSIYGPTADDPSF